MARPRIDRAEADAVLQELRRREEDDCDNFHHYELDAEHRLKNLFWADCDSRLDYFSHGDVVVFDTTYRTNKYAMPFVPFVGLSHHRTPTLFGCGIISDQSLDSYVWLLRTFLLSVAQRRPKSVITDGGDAVVAAVKIVFPDSNHRICSWHVEQAIEEHLHGASTRNEFRSLVCDACSPEAFEERWYGFMAKHRTAGNRRWLDDMYGKRELWAAAFVHDKFFLGMAGDQRTECLATRLHTGLHGGMSLPDLLRHADACAHGMRRARRRGQQSAARWFTPANFYLLREEIKMIDSFEVVEATARGHPTFGKKVYMVVFRQRRGVLFHVECSGYGVGEVIRCSCRKMEREGLPCRHILCAMRHNDSSLIPNCCALRRMRRRGDVKFERLHEMEELGRRVFDLASEDAQEFKEIKEFLEGWLDDRNAVLRGSGAVAVVDSNAADDADSVTPVTKKTKLIEG
ncbi:protein FAR-RED IMPAIRED RESPONSE 1-like [Panicum virgatum]|nr:protein FAR-RED IMPAIRED RESPONSE 1-like [Panicum virgatum]